jgi:hypothetical protein
MLATVHAIGRGIYWRGRTFDDNHDYSDRDRIDITAAKRECIITEAYEILKLRRRARKNIKWIFHLLVDRELFYNQPF